MLWIYAVVTVLTWLVIKTNDGEEPWLDFFVAVLWPATWLWVLREVIRGNMKFYRKSR